MTRFERKFLVHFIDSNMGAVESNYVRLGKDLEEYSETLNQQVSVGRTIAGEPVVSLGGYEVQSNVEYYYAERGDPLFEVIANIANNRLNDDSCRTTKVDALFDAEGTQIWAYREECVLVPTSVGGDTSGVQVPFEVYCAGNRVYGEFDLATKEFTAEDGSPSVGPVKELRVYENGTYTAPAKTAYSPVVVNVQPPSTEIDAELIARTISVYYNSEITKIGNYAFASCASLAEAVVPECEEIGSWAFYLCMSLTSAEFPLCTSIGESAFQGCVSLASVSFPGCITIGASAFQNGSTLQSVDFPQCETIGANAFSNHRGLVTVNFPKCKTISHAAFSSCSRLSTVSFPECTYISQYAFYRCSSLKAVSFPKCSYIGYNAFNSCRSLVSAYFTSTELAIGGEAFYSCYALSDVSVPNLGGVPANTFRYCSALETITLPKVSSVGASAFMGCRKLVSLYLMSTSVVTLGASAANVFGSTPVFTSTSSGEYCTIYVPSDLLSTYLADASWALISSRISAYAG